MDFFSNIKNSLTGKSANSNVSVKPGSGSAESAGSAGPGISQKNSELGSVGSISNMNNEEELGKVIGIAAFAAQEEKKNLDKQNQGQTQGQNNKPSGFSNLKNRINSWLTKKGWRKGSKDSKGGGNKKKTKRLSRKNKRKTKRISREKTRSKKTRSKKTRSTKKIKSGATVYDQNDIVLITAIIDDLLSDWSDKDKHHEHKMKLKDYLKNEIDPPLTEEQINKLINRIATFYNSDPDDPHTTYPVIRSWVDSARGISSSSIKKKKSKKRKGKKTKNLRSSKIKKLRKKIR